MKNIVILYHSDCTDGFTAAWVAQKKFGARASYLPLKHTDPVPKGLKNKTVYFLDIVYEMPVLKEVIRRNKKVIVLDHHVSRQKEVRTVTDYRYDINHSGAMLAWQYFFPEKKPPFFVKIVEEEDLWRFKSRGVKEILAAVRTRPFSFQYWDVIIRDLERAPKRGGYIIKGRAELERQKLLIQERASRAAWVKFSGRRALAVESKIFTSEIGHILARRSKYLGIVWSRRGRFLKVSLRSTGRLNVAKLAEKFGGGGHYHAAGFYLKKSAKLPWRAIEIKIDN